MLLEAGAEKNKAKDVIKQEYNYVWLYEDCTEVKTLCPVQIEERIWKTSSQVELLSV